MKGRDDHLPSPMEIGHDRQLEQHRRRGLRHAGPCRTSSKAILGEIELCEDYAVQGYGGGS